MSIFVPGTTETDPKKQNISLQQIGAALELLQAAGYVVGPASATNGGFARFSGTTGKLLQDHAASIALGSEVSGNLPVGNLNGGTNAAATTFWRGDGAWTVPVLSSLSAALGADTATNSATYTLGAQVAQGSSGTWLALANVTFVDTAVAQTMKCRITDGTTAFGSAAVTSAGANLIGTLGFAAIIASPAGNIRVESQNTAGATAKMLFNQSGNGFDTAIRVVRIA